MPSNEYTWYKLDNAAKIYPATRSVKRTSTFRVAVYLNEPVEPDILRQALAQVIQRFPSIAVTLRRGLFWYYFDTNQLPPQAYEETNYPCALVDPRETNGYFFKVIYYNTRISLQCFHSLTDGTGAFEVLKTLLYQYLKLKGCSVDCGEFIKNPQHRASKYEVEDSFSKYYAKHAVQKIRERKAQHIEGTVFEPYGINVVHAVMSVSEVKRIAKAKGLTITEYLATLWILSIYEKNMKYGQYNKPIRLSIPVNLRRLFPSQTLRNFSSYVNVEIHIDHIDGFDSIAAQVREQLREGAKKENLYPRMNANVKIERLLLLRLTPLFIKNLALKRAHVKLGEKTMTSTLSNTGPVTLPESMQPYVDRFEFVLSANKTGCVNMSICSYLDKLNITVSRAIQEPDILQYFFRTLSMQEGLSIRCDSNDWGIEHEAM